MVQGRARAAAADGMREPESYMSKRAVCASFVVAERHSARRIASSALKLHPILQVMGAHADPPGVRSPLVRAPQRQARDVSKIKLPSRVDEIRRSLSFMALIKQLDDDDGLLLRSSMFSEP
uniref:Uncharacterized protein n=1 Tax=Trichogramma kaykai TaxID=54128 RepID=A0ABD2X8W6_9HYME